MIMIRSQLSCRITSGFNSTVKNGRQVKVEKRVALVRKTRYQSIHFCSRFFIHTVLSGRSAAWLARLPWEQEVAGSNPAAPTTYLW